MIKELRNSKSILDAVSDTLDLDDFLSSVLERGVLNLGCDGGSVYLVDGASKTLRHCANTSRGRVSINLGMEEGVAGKGLKLGITHTFIGEELNQFFVDWGGTRKQDYLRAITTIPVYFRDIPQAVFCFDFNKVPDVHGEENLSPSEKDRVQQLSKEIEDTRFANALNRMRIRQAQLDIRSAGDGPARLQQAVAGFLTSILAAFPSAGKPSPDLAYLQLVDRRRGTIRTFQGVGMPLIFQTSLSHSLDSDDVQAYVVRYGQPLIIVGKDPLMDPVVYDRFQHGRFVRLWLPLFPFPKARLVQRPGKSIEELFNHVLQWGEPKSHSDDSLRVVANWNERFTAHPPSRLVFGTLELGYSREDPNSLSVKPLTPYFASWCAAKAYALSEQLFNSTLSGSLDRIAKSVANLVWPYKLKLKVAIPSWRIPEVRRYPASADWPAAIPEESKMITPPPGVPAKFELLKRTGRSELVEDRTRAELFSQLDSIAEEAARVALRLDDHVADLYTLIDEADKQEYFGTAYPDPRLDEILHEICREAAAESCIHFLFEKEYPALSQKSDEGGCCAKWRLLGKPHPWPQKNPPQDPTTAEYELARRVAGNQFPAYEFLRLGNLSRPVAILPLELTEQTQAVIILHSPMEGDIKEENQRELEGRIARWVYRLSLRNLVVNNRFSQLMGGLRSDLAMAQCDAIGKKSVNHLLSCIDNFLTNTVRTFKALAGLLILYSESATAPPTVDRFWCCKEGPSKVSMVESHTFVGTITESPARLAAETNDLILYPPNDPSRQAQISKVSEELLAWADNLQGDDSSESAGRLRRIVTYARDPGRRTTMIVIPVVGHAGSDRHIRGALTFILRGTHYLSQSQRKLVLEFGRLVAEALSQMRGLDSMGVEQSLGEKLDDLRGKLAGSKTLDEVYGHFLRGIGGRGLKPSKGAQAGFQKRWQLSDHVVVWMLASGYRELASRSGRGKGLEVLEKLGIMNPREHPFLERESNVYAPKKGHPRIDEFRIWTFSLGSDDKNALLRRYSSLSGCSWMVSFPLMQADSRMIGVVDCLREVPMRPEEEVALPKMLRRLSQQVCFALGRCMFERAIDVARKLTDEASAELDAFHAASVYRILVEKVQEELGVKHCDLLLNRDGTMILHGSTRLKTPIAENKRQNYWIQPENGEEVLGAAYAMKSPKLAHAASSIPAKDHLSRELGALLANDHLHERLVIPLGKRPDRREPLPGLLYCRGPLSRLSQDQTNKLVKKSGFLTFEHLRRAQDLAVVVYRNAMMARIVERKGWLISELQHQLGQPLQVLRGWCDDRLRDLNKLGVDYNELLSLNLSLIRGFDLVHEVRNNLAIYAKISQPIDASEMNKVWLKKVISKCCELMQPEAERKGCRIEYSLSHVKPIWGNPAFLRSAVINLLDNAIKYSYKDRQIVVDLQEDRRGMIKLLVGNYGVGIPEPDLKRIFQPYFRSKVPDEKGARPGSGIGLAIVWHGIVVGHAGKILVTSNPPRNIVSGLSAAETAKYPHNTTFTVIMQREMLDFKRRQYSNQQWRIK